MSLKFEGQLPPGKITANLSVLADTKFTVPPNWREWLGSVRAGEVEDCNLFLLSKLASSTLAFSTLKTRHCNSVSGISTSACCWRAPLRRRTGRSCSRARAVAGKSTCANSRILTSQSPACSGRIRPSFRTISGLPPVSGRNLEALAASPIAGGHWRLFRTLHIYTEARTTSEIVDRIYQYCRCIDGLILPDAGQTRRQFRSRTELFIGPGHHELMGELYDVRSAVEHLHENRYLESFDRAVRLDLAQKEAIVEYVAQTALARILAKRSLWPHFANTTALGHFWALPPNDRQGIWGDPVDPMVAIAEFDPTYIHNGLLGAP